HFSFLRIQFENRDRRCLLARPRKIICIECLPYEMNVSSRPHRASDQDGCVRSSEILCLRARLAPGARHRARAFAWPVGGRRRQTTIAKRWPVMMGPRFSRAFAGTTELVARMERSEIRGPV